MIELIAKQLKMAEQSVIAGPQISVDYPDLELKDAYAIQLANIDYELARGHVITGKKIGLTSLAVLHMLGVNQPDFGHLLDSMEVQNGIVPAGRLIQPKAEGEIAFVLKKDLSGPGVSVEDVLEATDYVCAAIEIVDSRVVDWKIGIVDTVADNASSGMYIVSDKRVDPKTIDLKKVRMEFYQNGEKKNEGIGSAALGDPAYCVAWLANTLSEFGVSLMAGEVILSGALSAMLPVEAGDEFRASFSELGDITVRFEEGYYG